MHGFSTRIGLPEQKGKSRRAAPAGLDLGTHAARQPHTVLENRRKFFGELGAEDFAVASLQQIHSAEVWQVQSGPAGNLEYRAAGYRLPPDARRTEHAGDALLTSQPSILLTVRAADCLPVLLVDPKQRVIAAVHAGWRGLLRRVVEKTVGEMRRIFGCEPRNLFAALGPSIRGCCYEVGPEVVDAFRGRFPRAGRFFHKSTQLASAPQEIGFLSMMPPGHGPPAGSGLNLDLTGVAIDQLESAGLRKSRVQTADFCTACRNDLFFSYRKEGNSAGRMMAVIGLRAPSTNN
ncbi:MAG: peptidoglycan editing factor PgeF [Candidatus Acidiferrales bacterium]